MSAQPCKGKTMTLTVGSLFSGAGGFDLGFEAAGMRTAWACEINWQARAVFRRNFPCATIHHDIRRLSRHAIKPVDVLCGGFPCQDLSVAGRRAGLAGKRSGLFFRFVRLVAKLRPKPGWIVLENVPGLLSSNGGRDMATVLRALEKRGYGWAYRVLDLQFFGAPQRRRRVFIVGHLGDWRSAAQVLFECESVPGNPPPRREAGAVVTQSLTRSLGAGGADDNRAQAGFYVPAAFGGNNTRGPINVAACLNACHTGSGRQDFESETFVVPIAPQAVRRITPVECERLMGWPDGHTAWGIDDSGRRVEMSDSARYRMCGNGVASPHSLWLGRRIMEVGS